MDAQVVLVLQGGGALGAYQAGVFEALHDAGIEPDWVIGTSIGAINGAIIAGNRPAERMERLRTFWDRVTWTGYQAPNWLAACAPVAPRSDCPPVLPPRLPPHGPHGFPATSNGCATCRSCRKACPRSSRRAPMHGSRCKRPSASNRLRSITPSRCARRLVR
nr:patatin-like phospholipase family protein [Paraburkholderia azotifigens]